MAQITLQLHTSRRWFYSVLVAASYTVLLVSPFLTNGQIDRLCDWLAERTVRWGVKVTGELA